jgi:hypothetical protein
MSNELGREKLHEIATKVAALLPGFTVKPSRDDAMPSERLSNVIVHTDGREIYFTDPWPRNGKVHISASLPNGWYNHKPYNSKLPSINVGAERGAETIAKEIIRRVLPEYDVIFAETKARVEAQNAHTCLTDKTAKRVAEIFGAALHEWGEYERDKGRYNPHLYLPSGGSAEVSGDTVTLKIGVTLAQAEAIAKLLKKA